MGTCVPNLGAIRRPVRKFCLSNLYVDNNNLRIVRNKPALFFSCHIVFGWQNQCLIVTGNHCNYDINCNLYMCILLEILRLPLHAWLMNNYSIDLS